MQISYHFVLTKIQNLQNLNFGWYGRYEAGTAGIFSGTKQGGRVYRIAGQYGIFWPYRPIRYGIDNLAHKGLPMASWSMCGWIRGRRWD